MVENRYTAPETEPPLTNQFSAEVNRGRIVVVCVIVFVIGFSILTILLFNLLSGSQRLPAQIVRFALTVGLAVCLYKGQSWARYVMAVLFGIAAAMSLFSLPAMISNAHPIMLGYFIVMIAGYAASAISLIAVPSVGKFLEHQRSRST